MATKPKYLVEVFWSDEDEGYIAIAPDLPGCSAFGETPEEAIREMQEARRRGWKPARIWGDHYQNRKPSHREQRHDGLLGDDTESGIVIPCLFEDQHVNFTAQMYLDCEPPTATRMGWDREGSRRRCFMGIAIPIPSSTPHPQSS